MFGGVYANLGKPLEMSLTPAAAPAALVCTNKHAKRRDLLIARWAAEANWRVVKDRSATVSHMALLARRDRPLAACRT